MFFFIEEVPLPRECALTIQPPASGEGVAKVNMCDPPPSQSLTQFPFHLICYKSREISLASVKLLWS